MSSSVIESCYERLSQDIKPIPGTLVEKCNQIAKNVGVAFSLAGKNVVFTKLLPPIGQVPSIGRSRWQ